MNTLRAWREDGAVRFVLRLGATGAFAGVVAWVLVVWIRSLANTRGSVGTGLSSAVIRGTLVGLAVGVLLEVRWRLRGRRR